MSSSLRHFTPLVAGAEVAPWRYPGHADFLKALTVQLVETYSACSSDFIFQHDSVPRRVLTKPYEAVHNNGYDNSEFDYICRVRDTIKSESGRSYEILDWLGRGTFGQVLKCQVGGTSNGQSDGGLVALKVIKNKSSYTEQARVEVSVLRKLNSMFEPMEEDRLVRMIEHFTFRKHLCIAFELLHENLYQVLERRGHCGLSLGNTKLVTAQLLEALVRLRDASIVHCDLKPENVMICCLNPIRIKLIDFGSACREDQPLHTYVQSRFYRAPEVLLGMSYTHAIDIWSLGCLCAEVFRGLPLFPGITSYDQLRRVVKALGAPPDWMLKGSRHGKKYFRCKDGSLPEGSQPELTPEKLAHTTAASDVTASEAEAPTAPPGASASPPAGEPDNALRSGGGASTDAAGFTAVCQADGPEGWPRQAPAGPDVAGATPPQEGQRGWRMKSPDEFKREFPPRDERRRRQLEEKGLVPSASQQENEIGCLDHLMQVVEPKVTRETSEEAWLAEQERRRALRQFLEGLLAVCPEARWTPGQAQRHPFVTGAAHVADFRPGKDRDNGWRTSLRGPPFADFPPARAVQREPGSLDFHPPRRHNAFSSTTATPASSPRGSATSAHASDRKRGARPTGGEAGHPHSPWHLVSDGGRSSHLSGSESSCAEEGDAHAVQGHGSSRAPSGTGTDPELHGEDQRRPTLADVAQAPLLPKRLSPRGTGVAGNFRQFVGIGTSGPVVPPRQ